MNENNLKFGYGRLTATLIIIMTAFIISGCGRSSGEFHYTTSSDEARQLFLEGLDNHENLFEDEARALFRKALKLDPDFAMAYYYLSLSSGITGDFQTLMNRAVDLVDSVSQPERLLILSKKAEFDDDMGKAQEYLEELVRVLPRSKRAHLHLGVFYYMLQMYQPALKECQLAVKLNPDFAPGYNMLAYIYVDLGQYTEAIEALKKYSDLRPKDPNPHDSMGEIFLAMGDFENSLKQYKEALKRESDFTYSIAGIANNYVLMGEYEKGRAQYREIFRKARNAQDTLRAHELIAQSYLYEKNADRAVDEYLKNLEYARSLTNIYAQAGIHAHLAVIFRERGDYPGSREQLDQMKDIFTRPDFQPGIRENYTRDYLFNDILVLTQTGKKDQAAQKYEKFRESAEASNNSLSIRRLRGLEGLMAYWNKDYATAIRLLNDPNPINQYFKYYLGLAYLKNGEEQKARLIFSEIAGYNRPSLTYALVRPEAEKFEFR